MKAHITIAAIFLSVGCMANLHDYGTCMERGWKGFQETAKSNSDITQKACNAYKNRQTGNNHWDKCPDCLTGYRGDVLVCNSPKKHIGGDEWQHYCKKFGAHYGSASP